MAETFDQTNCSTPKFILKKFNYVMYCVVFAYLLIMIDLPWVSFPDQIA